MTPRKSAASVVVAEGLILATIVAAPWPYGSAVDVARYVRPCGIAKAMWRAEDAWRAELKAVTIADINRELAASVDHEQIAKAIAWFQEVL